MFFKINLTAAVTAWYQLMNCRMRNRKNERKTTTQISSTEIRFLSSLKKPIQQFVHATELETVNSEKTLIYYN